MRHAIGLSHKDREVPWPLEHQRLFRFDSDSSHSQGYFWVFAPIFNRYAERDSGINITSINVLIRLQSDDLEEVLHSLQVLQESLEKGPISWREYLGEIQHPGQLPKPLNPLLFRSRALRILFLLRRLVESAHRESKLLVYGNGVCYRHLVDIALPEGTEEYS
jgi:hypothetical protein